MCIRDRVGIIDSGQVSDKSLKKMVMGVNQPGIYEFPPGIYDLRVRKTPAICVQIFTYAEDLRPFDQDIACLLYTSRCV